MTTPAEQEAERRYPDNGWLSIRFNDQGAEQLPRFPAVKRDRDAFIAGAEWSESRYRELLEAAEAYRKVHIPPSERNEDTGRYFSIWLADLDAADALEALMAAAAALEEA